MSPRSTFPRCPRHGCEVPPGAVCGLCRSEALEDGRERRHVDVRPRCAEHGLTLSLEGTCASCRADHLAGEHDRRTVTCPLCPPAPDASRWLDAGALAAGDRSWRDDGDAA